MIDRQGRHHRAAPRARAHDGTAHGVPHFHERHGARGIRPHAFDQRALGPQGGKVIADAAALLQRQRRFAHRAEDAVHGIGDGAHDKAVEQRDGAPRARARQAGICAPSGPRQNSARAPAVSMAAQPGSGHRPRASSYPPRRGHPRLRVSGSGISCPRSGGKFRSSLFYQPHHRPLRHRGVHLGLGRLI